jgi:hypothetical protein
MAERLAAHRGVLVQPVHRIARHPGRRAGPLAGRVARAPRQDLRGRFRRAERFKYTSHDRSGESSSRD